MADDSLETKSAKNDSITRVDHLPEIGILLDSTIKMTSNNRALMVNGSTISPMITVMFDGSSFDLAWDHSGRVNRISTTDSNFATPEGVKINTTLSDIKKNQQVDIQVTPGWGYYSKLSSGWYVGFCVDSTCTEKDLLNSDRVKWIFKK
jgi:hypothetical protein